ncbi:MAG: twin-arginine translocation signal domain-containing protein, partial [Verrucomicrobiales bacterium]
MKNEHSKPDHGGSATTRRNFMGGTAAVAAGTALSSISVATHAHAAGSDTLKVGLVGCGGRGRGAAVQHLLNEGTELVAMADVYQHRLDEG